MGLCSLRITRAHATHARAGWWVGRSRRQPPVSWEAQTRVDEPSKVGCGRWRGRAGRLSARTESECLRSRGGARRAFALEVASRPASGTAPAVRDFHSRRRRGCGRPHPCGTQCKHRLALNAWLRAVCAARRGVNSKRARFCALRHLHELVWRARIILYAEANIIMRTETRWNITCQVGRDQRSTDARFRRGGRTRPIRGLRGRPHFVNREEARRRMAPLSAHFK